MRRPRCEHPEAVVDTASEGETGGPALAGGVLRVPYTFAVAKSRGRNWTIAGAPSCPSSPAYGVCFVATWAVYLRRPATAPRGAVPTAPAGTTCYEKV